MTETQAEYQAGNEPDITYRCPRCGERLGHFVGLDNGGRILLIGGMIVLYSHGICGKCGKELYFRADGQDEETMVKSVAREAQNGNSL